MRIYVIGPVAEMMFLKTDWNEYHYYRRDHGDSYMDPWIYMGETDDISYMLSYGASRGCEIKCY